MSTHPSLRKRSAVLVYGVVSYMFFFATFLYALGFVGGFLVPHPIDAPARRPLALALLIDAGLLAVFALQHSAMARPAFKRMITRFIPEAMERSTYVLMSSLALILVFACWEPMGVVIWSVQHPLGRALLHGGFGFGWLTVLVTTFLINHFDLFGLRQVWKYFRAERYTGLKFVTPGPYKLVRHPLYVGWLFSFWCTPQMTLAHLVFAVMTTGYILVAIQLEERDLAAAHPEYADYKRSTPMLLPRVAAAPADRSARRVLS